MPTALDYSAARLQSATIKAAGHVGVIRYVGTPGRTKNITKAEFQELTRNGVSVALVYENKAGDANGGFSAGITAARAARADADSIGWPRERPIYFAIDSDQVTDLDFREVSGYLDGIASVLGNGIELTGVYGEYDVIERNVGSHARYGWQTVAWSGGRVSKKATLFQQLRQIYVGGIQVDVNNILAADWGQNTIKPVPTVEELMKTAEPHFLPNSQTLLEGDRDKDGFASVVFAVEVGKLSDGGNSTVVDAMWFVIVSSDFGDSTGNTEYRLWTGDEAGRFIGFPDNSPLPEDAIKGNDKRIFALKRGTRLITLKYRNNGNARAGYMFPQIGQSK